MGSKSQQSILERIRGGLIVSCQALPEEPLHSSYIMGRMAFAAKEGGAAGIRANTVEDITEIKKTVDLPVIGIIKKDYEDCEIYITPTMDEVDALAACGRISLPWIAPGVSGPVTGRWMTSLPRYVTDTRNSYSWQTALIMKRECMRLRLDWT